MCPLAIWTKWLTRNKTFALFASKCQYECSFMFDVSHLWLLATFCIDKSRKKTPQKNSSSKIRIWGGKIDGGKRLVAARSRKWAFKKCIEVLAATDGLVRSCRHLSLRTQPVTCSPDLLLAATIRYFRSGPVTTTTRYLRPRPVTCGHNPLLAVRPHYLRPRPVNLRPRPVTCGQGPLVATTTRNLRPRSVTCGQGPLLATTTRNLQPNPLLSVATRYFQTWKKSVSKVTHLLHWWNAPVTIPTSTQSTPAYILLN